MTVVTRFAPSPTGSLHVGSARTALFSWLYAKKKQGQFILRIEDTDTIRSTDESTMSIMDSLRWLHLDYDAGPFYQTKRLSRYQEVCTQLLKENKAYYCNCSKKRLEELREAQLKNKLKPRYDGHCRQLQLENKNKDCVIRFKNPLTGKVRFNDLIRGELLFDNAELDDLIIVRSDGVPTYNFTVVVDDWDMQITHVIRGDDHINNTPRQMNILFALGASLPLYAHIPMILGSDGKRLSKRHGAVSVMQYREEGFLKEALLNYLVRLGWSHGDQEIFSIDEMINLFEITAINKAAAAFNPLKLLWLNQHYIKTLPHEKIMPELVWHFQQLNIDYHNGPSLDELLTLQKDRVKTIRELVLSSRFFYEDTLNYNDEALKTHITLETKPFLQAMLHGLQIISNWQKETLHQTLITIAEKNNTKLGKIAQPLRVAITGNTSSPSIDKTLELLGKERVLQRINYLLENHKFD